MSQTILVLGATSAIAIAYCRRLAAKGDSFVLVSRQNERLHAIGADLKVRGAAQVYTIVSALAETTCCEARFKDFCSALGAPHQVILAYGFLGDQYKAEDDPEETRRIIEVNFTSAALWSQMAAKHLPKDKPRWLIILSSVAGDRGRRSNYVYGAAKAGLAVFAEGIAHRLHGTNLRLLTVKIGLVDTPMTAHFDRSGPLWSKPDQIAASIARAVRRGRGVVYAPGFWQVVMAVIRFLPRPILHRTKL